MSLTIDQQFVEFIVKSLVGEPDKVEIKRTIDEKGVLLELSVAQEDLGRVIGKRGATAQSIRTLLRALGTKNEARYNLKIIDPEGGPRPQREDAPAAAIASADDSSAPVDDSSAPADEPAVVAEDSSSDETPVAVADPVEEKIPEVALPIPADEEAEEDSMVARHRRDLEDFDDDEL